MSHQTSAQNNMAKIAGGIAAILLSSPCLLVSISGISTGEDALIGSVIVALLVMSVGLWLLISGLLPRENSPPSFERFPSESQEIPSDTKPENSGSSQQQASNAPSEAGVSGDERQNEQRPEDFYDHLVYELQHGRAPEVGENVAYLYRYATQIVEECVSNCSFGEQRLNGSGGGDAASLAFPKEHVHLREASALLLDLSEKYSHQEQFSESCRNWAGDCFLLQGQFEEYLRITEDDDIAIKRTHKSNIRCNVYYFLGEEPRGLDLLQMTSRTPTKFSRENPGPFIEHLEDTFRETAEEEGPWLERAITELENPTPNRGYNLFSGVGILDSPKIPIPTYYFYSASDFLKEIETTSKEAENRLRDEKGISRIGEGWVAETELYRALEDAFPETRVIQHAHPTWLGRQHLDIWFPHWQVAVEYHGKQHFEPVEFFGGQEAFEKRQRLDAQKEQLCKENSATLIIATRETPTEQVIKEVEKARAERQGTITRLHQEMNFHL